MNRFAIILVVLLGVNTMTAGRASKQPGRGLGESFNPQISVDATQALVARGRLVFLYDLGTGKAINRFQGHGEVVRAVTFSPDRKCLLSAGGREDDMASISTDNSARLWNTLTGQEIRRFDGHKAYVHTVEFSSDGKRVLTVSRDSTARIWEVETGKELFVFSDLSYLPPSAALSPDGDFVLGVIGSGEKIALWDSQSGKMIGTLKAEKGVFSTVRFGPNSNLVVTGSSEGNVRTWNFKTGQAIRDFSGHIGRVEDVRFIEAGKQMISASADGTMRLWDVSSSKELRRLIDKGAIDQMIVSSNGKRAFTRWHVGEQDKPLTIRKNGTLWDLQTGRAIIERPDVLGFTPDGKELLLFESIDDLEKNRPATMLDANTGKIIPRLVP
jgi:WD40 repeat protein